MSKYKHSGKPSDSHNKSVFFNTPTSEYPSPNSIYGYSCDEEAEYGKKIILNKFFNSVVIYENLCMNCGYPLYNKSLIHEYLCINCKNLDDTSIYHDENQLLIKKRNVLSDLFVSIKKIASSKNNNTITNKKTEIIHNVGNVFKTNRTFDINEISELKNNPKSLETIASADQNHTSYKKKKTNTILFPNEDKSTQASNIDDWMASLRTHTCYYQLTDTDNILNVKCIPSKNCFNFSCCPFPSDVTTSVHMSLNSLESVSFSSDISNKSFQIIKLSTDFIDDEYKNQILRFKTNLMEYKKDSNQTQMKNVKLRSNKRYLHNKGFVNIVGEASPSQHEYNESDSSQSALDSDCSRQLGLFKSSNRNGFYRKNSTSSDFVNDILAVFDSYLNCDSQTHTLDGSIQLPARGFENTNTDTKQNYSCNDIKSSDSDKKECERYTLKCSSNTEQILVLNKRIYIEFNLPIDINEVVKNLCINISLNKIVIYYDNNLKIFLKYIKQKQNWNLSQLQLVNFFLKWATFWQKEKPKQSKRKIMTVPTIMLSTSSDSEVKSSITHNTEEENIYHSIWKFKTFEKGEAQSNTMIEAGSCESSVNLDLLECDDSEWEPTDDISYHTYQKNLYSSDTIKSKQSSSSELVLTNTSLTITNDFRHKIKYNKQCDIGFQYNTICILYSEKSEDFKLRAIIYDYQPFKKLPKLDIDQKCELNKQSSKIKRDFVKPFDTKIIDQRKYYIELWKRCLYMEDEEEMYISSQEISSFNSRPVLLENESLYDRPRDSSNSSLKRYKSISSGNLLDATTNDKKTITENLKYKFDAVDIIERIENIQVDGLYRTSGNKVDVDNLKKKLITSTYDKSYLYTDDINTLTSLLKLFFRELHTPLIPEESYDKLPSNLLKHESIHLIKHILNDIPQLPKETLKFLLKHLRVVSHHSQSNRMPASNLAIVWGPCILAANNLGPLDIARMNTLAKVLIEHYDNIFDDNERYIL